MSGDETIHGLGLRSKGTIKERRAAFPDIIPGFMISITYYMLPRPQGFPLGQLVLVLVLRGKPWGQSRLRFCLFFDLM